MWFADPAARLHLGLAPDAPLRVRWEGYLRNPSGYGHEGRHLALGLARAGWEVVVRTVQDVPGFEAALPAGDRALLAELLAREPGDEDVVVQNVVPNLVGRRAQGGYQVARTMFESDGLNPAWLAQLRQVDEVWVPTAFNARTFPAAGLDVPVHVVPGGVDTALFAPGAAPLPALADGPGTTFLAVAADAANRRKGWDVLLTAWALAFEPGDDVRLVLKVDGADTGSPDAWGVGEVAARVERVRARTERWVDATLAALGRNRSDVAPVVVLPDLVPEALMPALYAAADAVVMPSRGEGYGLPALEAMACGVPLVATDWSGLGDLLDEGVALPVDVERLVEIRPDEMGPVYAGQRWAQPSVPSLVAQLHRVVDDRAAMAAVGAAAREHAVRAWDWSVGVAAAAARLEAIGRRVRRRPAAPDAVRVRWEGEQYSTHSLAHVNRGICRELVADPRVALEVATREVDPVPDLVAGSPDALLGATAPVHDVPQVTVRHQWPPDWTPPARGAYVLVQPWEFGGLPQEWADGARLADEIWCYSTWVRDCYELSGVPAEKLRVVPLGVDTDVFSPDGDRHPLATTKGTRLLYCGGPLPRKGIDVLVAAYLDAFTADDDVCLVVKAHGTRTTYPGSRDHLDELLERAALPGAPAVEVIDEDLTTAGLAALYRACDALVHPYRGEGFALPVAEAMACGLPVVVTAVGATADFCDEATGWLVPAEVRRLRTHTFGPGAAKYFWAEPDAAALGALLREVVDRPDERVRRGAAARRRIAEGFTWRATARAVADRLAELAHVVPLAERPVPALATRSRRTVLHVPGQHEPGRPGGGLVTQRSAGAQATDALVTYLATYRAGDDICLVLPVAPDPAAVAEAVEDVRARIAAACLPEHEVPEILLVPAGPDELPALRAMTAWSTDDPGVDLPALGRRTPVAR
ncbi:glycosyltransferase family 4 protein [Cellulomonas marina]|uniref:Glycosyltransferase involved in cell wall bisynthesis n=1 Tax=Cellulomonas marina TaxID=988821 RepID=A0A1I0WJV8_9CELL|nr:glycosyltransferase [Cellulomonas marina]GIG27675.1 hypothetical protein Cma02nite_02750 [Cellulomonas marina]SFA88420.1 Glycosyltransferase involved in cell wall bisynthesis [Cellulomonas marina]